MPTWPTLSKTPDLTRRGESSIADIVDVFEPEAGESITTLTATAPNVTWSLGYTAMSETDYDTLKAFEVDTAKYGAVSFTWTHPDTAESHTVYLAAPILYKPAGPDLWDFSIELVGQ